MDHKQPGLVSLILKTIAAHSVTYLVMGLLASNLLNYAALWARPDMAALMRPLSDPWVMAGLLFQPIRGVIFALAFYPLREVLFGRKNGWLVLWWLLVALGILSTFGPALGSVEGMIYTIVPIRDQILGWLEVIPQAFLLSAIVFYWVNNPQKKWLNWVMGALLFITLLLPTLGLLARR